MLRQQLLPFARLGAARSEGLGALPALRWFSQAAPADAAAAPQLPPFDFQPPPYTGPSKEEVLALRKAHLNPGEVSERDQIAMGLRRRHRPTAPPPLGLAHALPHLISFGPHPTPAAAIFHHFKNPGACRPGCCRLPPCACVAPAHETAGRSATPLTAPALCLPPPRPFPPGRSHDCGRQDAVPV